MLFMVSLLPATILAVIGFFVVFATKRSEGGLKRFGKYLGGWMFFLAGVTVLAGALAPILGMDTFMDEMAQHMDAMSSGGEQRLELSGEPQRD